MWQAHNFTHEFGKKHERSTHVFEIRKLWISMSLISWFLHQISIKSSQIAKKNIKFNINEMRVYLLWNSMPNTSFTRTLKWFANIGFLSSFLWSKHELSVYLFVRLSLKCLKFRIFRRLIRQLEPYFFRNSAKRRNRQLFGMCARETLWIKFWEFR